MTKIALRPKAQKKVLQESLSYDMISPGNHEISQVNLQQVMEEIKADSGNEGVYLKKSMALMPRTSSWCLGDTLKTERSGRNVCSGKHWVTYERCQFDLSHQGLPWFASWNLIALHWWYLYCARKPVKMIIYCPLYHALAKKQLPTDLKDSFLLWPLLHSWTESVL